MSAVNREPEFSMDEAMPHKFSVRNVSAIRALSLLGLIIASYLTLFEIGVLATVWDPIFGDGSARVLFSRFSRALPFPDAAVGLAGYVVDFVILTVVAKNGVVRPFVYALLASILVSMALGSFALVLLQAFAIHHFCLLCLVSALISFSIFGLEFRGIRFFLAELIAAISARTRESCKRRLRRPSTTK